MKSANPWQITRRKMVLSTTAGGLVSLFVATLSILVLGPTLARDLCAGIVIGWLPQLWFVLSGASRRHGPSPVFLAVGKYSLTAAGFALWFALMPTSNAIATLAGTMATIIMVPTMAVFLMGRSKDG